MIMVDRDGVVKLADLGLARALSDKEAAQAEAGRAYGTPYYISPEQIRGDVKIGPGADIYGLGATFYHMVTGRVPFSGKNPTEVMHKHLKSELVPPDHRAVWLGLNPAGVLFGPCSPGCGVLGLGLGLVPVAALLCRRTGVGMLASLGNLDDRRWVGLRVEEGGPCGLGFGPSIGGGVCGGKQRDGISVCRVV